MIRPVPEDLKITAGFLGKGTPEQAKAKSQEMMGENEIGLLDGRVAVRWTKVTSMRLDVQKAKEILDPKIFGFLSRESTSRRFTLADADEHS